MRSLDDMETMFDELTDLTLQQRRTIKSRYRFLMNEYRRRCRIYTFLFYTLRITMTVGSLVVPALLSLRAGPDTDQTLYWITWAISLAVTTSNGLTTLFKLDKRFFMLQAVAEKIRSETWQYLALAGRYSGHYGGAKPTHKNQYVYYCSYLEKVRMRHIVDEYLKPAELADKKNGGGDGADGNDGGDAKKNENAPPANTGFVTSSVPSPPNPADLKSPPPVTSIRRRDSIASPPPPAERRESESTIGSNDTIVEVGNSHTQTAQGDTVSLHDGVQRRAVPTPGRTEEPLLSRTQEKL
jgi:hypothetical protein